MATHPPQIPDPPVKTAINRVDALVCLRGFACLMVIIAHCDAPKAAILYKIFDKQLDFSWVFFSAGGVAVRIFFCLSGYLMGKLFYTQRYPPDTSGIIKFWRNRILRIFPLYYFALISLSIFIYPHIFQQKNWQYLIRLLTFTYNQSLPVIFNGALWSLSTEVQFYLIVPFIYIFLKNRLTKPSQIWQTVLLLQIGLLIIRYLGWQEITANFQDRTVQLNEFAKYLYTPMVANLDSFLCGFLLNPLILHQNRHPIVNHFRRLLPATKNQQINPKQTAITLLLLLYFLTAYIKYHSQPILLIIAPTITSAVTCYFIWVFEAGVAYQNTHKKQPVSLIACLKTPWVLAEIFGILSYSVYIWHLPIIVAFTPIFTSPIPLEAYFKRVIATLIIATLTASATYYLIELPALQLKTSKKSTST
jgi:peptidoglycan/LPS O-acetylase OafA/YrhL